MFYFKHGSSGTSGQLTYSPRDCDQGVHKSPQTSLTLLFLPVIKWSSKFNQTSWAFALWGIGELERMDNELRPLSHSYCKGEISTFI